jgi:hypothetical protein
VSKAGLVNDVRELPVKNVNDEGKSRGYSGRRRGLIKKEDSQERQ